MGESKVAIDATALTILRNAAEAVCETRSTPSLRAALLEADDALDGSPNVGDVGEVETLLGEFVTVRSERWTSIVEHLRLASVQTILGLESMADAISEISEDA